MLPEQIKITEEDIACAEKILLPEGMFFNTERQDFIRYLETVDLQAVPGSGKTTAILAKLLIFEKYLPFDDGSGILIISHTNAAINEIKKIIGKHCPKLFSYPNFLGTIQSFVDYFLAFPFYVNKYKKKPYRIDNEIYDEKIKIYYDKFIEGNCAYIDNKTDPVEFLKKIRYNQNEKLIQEFGKKPEDFKPKETSNTTKKIILPMKEKMMKFGYLHFDDAYFLANVYLQKFPQIKKLLQKRFRFIFVDEMQDMGKHQYNLLEDIFHGNGDSKSIFQRIGDKNQAIYSSGSYVGEESFWEDRKDIEGNKKVLKLNGSHRLSPKVADVVKYFGLDYLEIEGLNTYSNIKPYIIVFDKPEDVLKKFTVIIKNEDLKDDMYPFCAIGWTSDYKKFPSGDNKGKNDYSKHVIKSYHPIFEKDEAKPKIDYRNLKSHLLFYDKEKETLEPIRKNILNAFLKILRLDDTDKTRDENGRNYTKRKLINYLKDEFHEKYEGFKLKLYEWSFEVKKGNVESIFSEIKEYIPNFLKEVFEINVLKPETQSFLNEDSFTATTSTSHSAKSDERNNLYKNEENGIEVKVGTVHSVKGKTHTATLYMESYYYNDGGKSYESQRLINQIIKRKKLSNGARKRIKQSAKMVYVGFSRPTHLLCFAVHKDRINDDFENENWEIEKA